MVPPHASHHSCFISPLHSKRMTLLQIAKWLGITSHLFEAVAEFPPKQEAFWPEQTCCLNGPLVPLYKVICLMYHIDALSVNRFMLQILNESDWMWDPLVETANQLADYAIDFQVHQPDGRGGDVIHSQVSWYHLKWSRSALCDLWNSVGCLVAC